MTKLIAAAPVIAPLDIERMVAFYCARLGFGRVCAEPGAWGIVARDFVQLHFLACDDRHAAVDHAIRPRASRSRTKSNAGQCSEHRP